MKYSSTNLIANYTSRIINISSQLTLPKHMTLTALFNLRDI